MKTLRLTWVVATGLAAGLMFSACSGDSDPTMYMTGTESLPIVDENGALSCPDAKVLLCHMPPGNPANAHSICVGAPAVKAHQKNHSDALGACDQTPPGCDPTANLDGTESKPVKGAKKALSCTGKKILICHIPPGNPANAHTLCVGRPAERAHVDNHGDTLGACATEPEEPPSPEACQPPGQPCSNNGQCSSNACVDGTCKVPVGGPCQTNTDCGSQRCVQNICEAPPPGGNADGGTAGGGNNDGGSSNGGSSNGGSNPPADGGTNPGSGEPPFVEGTPCTANGQCASGACVAQVCTGGLPEGAACASSASCASEVCQNGHCAGGGVPNGGVCGDDRDCTSNICTQNFCEGRPTGESCTQAAQCASNNCASNLCTPTIN